MSATKDDVSAKILRQRARERFAIAEKLEAEYLRALRQLTRQVEHIVKQMAPEAVVKDSAELQSALRRYAEQVRPWATAVANKMVTRIARKDEAAWAQLGTEMGRALRKEIQEAPTGEFLRMFLQEQVHLITSLPLDAAERVHKLTTEGITKGLRVPDVMKEILRTGEVTESRARLIARTEIARTASGLTMARAQYVGSTHYIWRTSHDADVRDSHKQMEGTVIPWATAPILSDGTQTHAGMIYNCRCYPQPIIGKEL